MNKSYFFPDISPNPFTEFLLIEAEASFPVPAAILDLRRHFRPPSWICDVTWLPAAILDFRWRDFRKWAEVTWPQIKDGGRKSSDVTNPRWRPEVTSQIQDGGRNRQWSLSLNEHELSKHHYSPDFELTMPRPPRPISCPMDRRLLVTIVVRCWPLTIYSWSVQCYKKVVTNTTPLTHWLLYQDSSIWYEPLRIGYYSSFESSVIWCKFN